MSISRISLLAIFTACSSTPATSDGGVDGSTSDATSTKEAGTKDAGTVTDSGNLTDAGSDAPTLDPQCTVAALDAGSGGSCITVAPDAGMQCNPVTNSGCDAGAGEACDRTTNGGTHCFPPPPPNSAALCATCDDENGPACAAGASCVGTTNGLACAHFCCDDTDCAPGHCDTTTYNTAPLGFCVK